MSGGPRRFKGRIKPPTRLVDASYRSGIGGGGGVAGHQFEDDFEKLRTAFAAIYDHKASTLSFEELYRTAYNLVLYKHAESLYHGVKEEISKWLDREVVMNRVDKALKRGPDVFLASLVQGYRDHRLCLRLIGDILMYMDKVYCQTDTTSHVRTDLPPSTRQMGLNLFRDLVIRRGQDGNVNGKGKAREDREELPIYPSLIASFLDLVRLERNGGLIDRSILKGVCTMLKELVSLSSQGVHFADEDHMVGTNVYRTDLEGPILADTTSFYAQEGARLVLEMSVSEYIRHVSKRLEEEHERTANFLDQSTTGPLLRAVETELIWRHQKFIFSGLVEMINQVRTAEITLMYKLLGKVEEGHLGLKSEVKKYIISSGNAIQTKLAEGKGPETASANTAIALQWVEDVLSLKERSDHIFAIGFVGDKSFESSFNGGFESFINACPKAPENLSLFIDDRLKRGLKEMTESQVEATLDKTIALFRFLLDKDVFERYYKIHLARRLLHSKVVNDDTEKSILAKFKIEVGYQFTTKMEGMFNDMRISSEIFEGYQKSLMTLQTPPTFSLSTTVLTSTFWPNNFANTLSNEATGAGQCLWPEEIQYGIQTFQRYYNTRHSGRKLTWQALQGNADIQATFNSRVFDLNVSTYGMVILLQFNNVDPERSLTMDELRTLTNIPESDLIRNLQSLSLAKYRVLRKTPMTRDVKSTDSFSVNVGFTAPLARIKIPTIAMSSSSASSRSVAENDSESKETREKIEEARKHMIEASIVRIMKDRKTMEHNLLIAEVTRHMADRFIPNPTMIKKRIESLLEREYLERAQTDTRRYNYLA